MWRLFPSSQKRSPHAWPPADSATVREKGFLREAAVVKLGSLKRSSNCKLRNISNQTTKLGHFFFFFCHVPCQCACIPPGKEIHLLRNNVAPPQMNVDGVQRGCQKKEVTLAVERSTLEDRWLSLCDCSQFQTWILFYLIEH